MADERFDRAPGPIEFRLESVRFAAFACARLKSRSWWMSEHDLGAYAPPTADAPLSFDARHPVRGARPFPVTLVISGLVLLGLVVAIFLFYRSGLREAGQSP